MQLKDQQTGEMREATYEEHYDLFSDEDFVQSSMSPPNYFNCVAVAKKGDVIAVRSSYDEEKRTVFFNPNEWNSFLHGVKNGEFDFDL